MATGGGPSTVINSVGTPTTNSVSINVGYNLLTATLIDKGVCYSTTNTYPNITHDSQSEGGANVNPFDINITGLTEDTLYYFTSYINTNAGYVYSPYANQVTTTAPPMDIGQRISASIYSEATSLSTAISTNISASTDELITEITTQFTNRHII